MPAVDSRLIGSVMRKRLKSFSPATPPAGQVSDTNFGSAMGDFAVLAIFLRFTKAGVAATQAQIDHDVAKIGLDFNQKNRWLIRPAFLRAMLMDWWHGALGGEGKDDGVLCLPLAPWFILDEPLGNGLQVASDSLRIGTADLSEIRLWVQWAATISDITKVDAWALTVPSVEGCGAHLWVRETVQTHASTDWHELELPAADGSRLVLAGIYDDGTIRPTELSVKRGAPAVEQFEGSMPALEDSISGIYRRLPTAGWAMVDPLLSSDRLSSSIPLGRQPVGMDNGKIIWGDKPGTVFRSNWADNQPDSDNYNLVLVSAERWAP